MVRWWVPLSLSLTLAHTHTHTHTYRYAYGHDCGATRQPKKPNPEKPGEGDCAPLVKGQKSNATMRRADRMTAYRA